MNSARYILSIVLLTNTFLVCMNACKTAQQFFTLIPKNQPLQPCTIPLEHAKQCQPIVNLFGDLSPNESLLSLPDWPIEDVSGKDILNFIFYLEDIYSINQLHKDNVNKQQPFHNRIIKQINSFTTPELLNLFSIVDAMDVVDRNKNGLIVDEVASRIVANLDQANVLSNVFSILDSRPLFRNVVEKINNRINFEKKCIEPYGKTLIERQELDRTVPVFTAMWYNLTNALTAPVRLFASPSWATKTIMKPYYLNNQTKTMITGFVQKLGEDKTTTLLITNKKTNRNITISLADKFVTTIKAIEANKDESVFICRTPEKTIIINTLDKENPVIDNNFTDCVFSSNNDELYAIKKHSFGIFNIQTNTFTCIPPQPGNCSHIKINKDKSTLAICFDSKNVWICKNNQFNFLEEEKSYETEIICNISLHPTDNTLYVHYYDFQKGACIKTVSVNTTTKEKKHLDLIIKHDSRITKSNDYIFQFIAGSDILFIGTPAPKKLTLFSYSPWQDDYFVNTKNGHVWSKEKNKSDEFRIFGTKEMKIADCYERIAFTADGRHAIEQKAENYALLDLCNVILAAGKEPMDLSINKIAAAPLIDESMLEIINNLNKGFISLKDLSLMQQKIKDQASQQKQKESTQFIRETIATMLGVGAIILGLKLKAETESKKYLPKGLSKITPEKDDKYTIEKIVMPFILGTFLLFFLNQMAAQY